MELQENLQLKYEQLKEHIAMLENVAVAFSGGIDSTLLLKVAHDILGDKAMALTVFGPFVPQREKQESLEYCKTEGITHKICEVSVEKIEQFAENPVNRCYYCKKVLFGQMLKLAQEEQVPYLLEGSNLDDMGDYRPGMQAIAELGIISPLKEAGFTKADVRTLAKYLGIPFWNKPSYACLASRFPYGETITVEKLKRTELAEDYLIGKGFVQMRVRNHGDMARIELTAEQIGLLWDENLRMEINGYFKSLGFTYVTLDLQGFRSGSMNETLMH